MIIFALFIFSMRYLCTNCNYIYDEWEWDGIEDIDVSTKFEDLWDSFVCPVCWDGRDGFHEITEEINYLDENTHLYDLEIDHFPDIEVKGEKLIVSVWNGIHPMWDSHRISSVSLYDEYWDLIEEKFLWIDEDPVVEFDFDDRWEYEIRVKCTLHGVWWRKITE